MAQHLKEQGVAAMSPRQFIALLIEHKHRYVLYGRRKQIRHVSIKGGACPACPIVAEAMQKHPNQVFFNWLFQDAAESIGLSPQFYHTLVLAADGVEVRDKSANKLRRFLLKKMFGVYLL